MRCLQIAISSLKWKARSFCTWASTAGKPSKTDHLQPFRLAGTECDLGKDELAGKRVLDFTRYLSRDSKWEGNDYHIWIASEQQRRSTELLSRSIRPSSKK